jgi:hypothetical protein
MMHGVAKLLLTPSGATDKQRRIALPGKTEATVELHRAVTRILDSL